MRIKAALSRRALIAPVLVLFAASAVMSMNAARPGEPAPDQAVAAAPRVPPGFRAAPNTTPEPFLNSGFAREVIHEKSGLVMVFVPHGTFGMGTMLDEPGKAGFIISVSEVPKHQVLLTRPFYMGKYEVTNADFRRFRPGHSSGRKIDGKTDLDADGLPAVRISWDDAQAYAGWAGFQVPTEAEWEHACRAGTNAYYPFGKKASGLGKYAWHSGNSGRTRRSHPVGEKRPNDWGLYDMLGNVWEWCVDWYNETYYADWAIDHPNVVSTDPQGPETGQRRALRGGSWAVFPVDCRPAARFSGDPSGGIGEDCGVRFIYRIDGPRG
jgi:formylglycine-generating enzyme required for sulfatase activity